MIDNFGPPAFVIVSVANVARRAYEIYAERGYAHGRDREDWLRAERELKDPNTERARRRPGSRIVRQP
jgi:hypothetical protein